ncbi:hypothetical protein L914_00237, partial [Phytophthora nicotianae]
MADQAREEEEARTAEAVRRASVEASRTRAEKSRAMKIGREEKEGVDVSTESGPNEATTADASTDIQHSDDGDEHEDEEDSASASEEEKDEVVHSGTRGKKKRPHPMAETTTMEKATKLQCPRSRLITKPGRYLMKACRSTC